MANRHSGYEKTKNDTFYTPFWVFDVLLEHEEFEGSVLEAAAGDLAGVEYVEQKLGIEIDYCEIALGYDFFEVPAGMYRNVFTNPPWSGDLGVRFIEHALAVTAPAGGTVAMLLPHGFDTTPSRSHLFSEEGSGFAAKYVLTDRIRWRNIVQKKAKPSGNHAWYVWHHGYEGPAVTRYIYDADPEAVAERARRALRRAA